MTKYLFGKTEASGNFWIYQILPTGEKEPWREYPSKMKHNLEREYKELETNCIIEHELNLLSGWKVNNRKKKKKY